MEGINQMPLSGEALKIILPKNLMKLYVVVNLAANTEPEKSVGRESEVENINFIGTKNLAEYCKKYDVPFIFPSSTSVYTSNLMTI